MIFIEKIYNRRFVCRVYSNLEQSFPKSFIHLRSKLLKNKEALDILDTIHTNLDNAISESPPLTLVKLSPVGYYGFRQATMIEPFWNAYFLGLVISLAEKIEQTRIKEDDKNE